MTWTLTPTRTDSPLPRPLPAAPGEDCCRRAARFAPLAGASAFVLLAMGFANGLLLTPSGEWHTDANRILLLHLPAAGLALATFVLVAVLSARVVLVPDRSAARLVRALTPTGIVFTLLALWSGAMWQKPTHGQWWGADTHALAGVMLLVLFAMIVAVRSIIDEPRRADRAGALVALVGGSNLALFLGVQGWVAAPRAPYAGLDAATPSMGADLAMITAGFAAYLAFAVLTRLRVGAAERGWHEALEGRAR